MTEILALIFQYGVPVDERNLRKFLKDYEVGGLERIFEGVSQDAKQVTMEHRQLRNGVPLRINSYDNHEFHIAEHTEEQKTARYASYPPEIKQLFDQHVMMHREHQVKMAEMQAQQQAQQAQQAELTQIEAQAEADQETEIVKAKAQPNPNRSQ